MQNAGQAKRHRRFPRTRRKKGKMQVRVVHIRWNGEVFEPVLPQGHREHKFPMGQNEEHTTVAAIRGEFDYDTHGKFSMETESLAEEAIRAYLKNTTLSVAGSSDGANHRSTGTIGACKREYEAGQHRTDRLPRVA